MVTTTSQVAGGAWNDPATWDNGVPTIADDAVIAYAYPVIEPSSGEMAFKTLSIGDSLQYDNDLQVAASGRIQITGNRGSLVRKRTGYPVQRKIYSASGIWNFYLDYTFPDTRIVDVGGTILVNNIMTISCNVWSGSYGYNQHIDFGTSQGYWMGELGLPSSGKSLIEANNSGAGSNFSKFDHGTVRSLRLQLKFPKVAANVPNVGYIDYAEALRRWAQSPYDVLVVGRFNVFKGHIESVVYNDQPGSTVHQCTVTVVEGRDG